MICVSQGVSGKMCKHFTQGRCTYGNRCIHLHLVPNPQAQAMNQQAQAGANPEGEESDDEDDEEEEEEQEYEEENLDLLDEVHAMREEQAAER